MTSEEIKESTSMRDVLRRCGLPEPNRASFISCPFHQGDREPSLKVYEKDYHCYSCGANGDIFTFLQQYEGISFKEAFLALGGAYPDGTQESWFRRQRRRYQQEARRETELRQKRQVAEEKSGLIWAGKIYAICLQMYEPLSDDWCDCYNWKQLADYRLAYLNGKR